LPQFAGAALEPVLGALARTAKGAPTAESLCCMLAVLGVRDERILRSLLDLLEVRPRAAAVYLTDYGDPAACPALLDAMAAFPDDRHDADARRQLASLVDAHASLGGELPASMRARIDAWLTE
jgi:hypothetical protein